jgi:hypothetical protein
MEIVEQDTVDAEDIPNLLQYILPDGILPENTSMFGMHFNKRIFNGWVKQPSACCGAASVAGAWNSLCNFHRTNLSAVQHNDVLVLYREMFQGIIETKQTSFERKLGAPITVFLEILKYRLEIYGKEIGGKKGFGPTKKIVVLIIKQLVRENYEANHKNDTTESIINTEIGGANFHRRSAVDCFTELLAAEGYDVQKEVESLQAEVNALNEERRGESSSRQKEKSSDVVAGESDYEVQCQMCTFSVCKSPLPLYTARDVQRRGGRRGSAGYKEENLACVEEKSPFLCCRLRVAVFYH